MFLKCLISWVPMTTSDADVWILALRETAWPHNCKHPADCRKKCVFTLWMSWLRSKYCAEFNSQKGHLINNNNKWAHQDSSFFPPATVLTNSCSELITVSNHLFAELFTQVGSVLSSFIQHAGPLIIYKTKPEFVGPWTGVFTFSLKATMCARRLSIGTNSQQQKPETEKKRKTCKPTTWPKLFLGSLLSKSVHSCRYTTFRLTNKSKVGTFSGVTHQTFLLVDQGL